MYLLSVEELKTLMTQRPGWHVSLYLPTQRAGTETLQNPVRCKNLRRQAAEQLLASGLRATEVETMLAPVDSLLESFTFWQHQSDGLAIFIAADFFRTYRLPLAFAELMVVNKRFHVKPLLPLLTNDGRFYLLALSQNNVRMFDCTRYHVSEIDLTALANVPTSLAEALQYDDPEEQLQFHTGTTGTGMPGGPGGTGARRAAIYHGQGVGKDDTKVNIWRFFRLLDKGLQTLLHDEQAPLVLAGVDYILPLYREANTYAHLVEEGVPGNPEGVRAEELQAQAWDILAPQFRQGQEVAAATYHQYLGTGRASNHLLEIVPAAYYGRIDTLFVTVGMQQWGNFIPETPEVRLHQEATPDNEDLLDFAALHTFLNSGTVYAVEPDEAPDSTPLAAVYRY
jgi:hypothetical protein